LRYNMILNMLTDQELIKKYFSGEENAFRELTERYLNYTYNFIVRFCGSRDVADDLVQETWLRIWKNLHRFDLNKKFTTWSLAIAKNVVIDWHRKRKEPSFSELETEDNNFTDTIPDNLPRPDELFDQKFLHEQFETAVTKLLSTTEQTILFMHLEQELTFAEIAEILKKPLNTIKSNYRRSLDKIKNNWKGQ
ncbi:MAG: RNA polymerase sigma factor, partial [bacterium]